MADETLKITADAKQATDELNKLSAAAEAAGGKIEGSFGGAGAAVDESLGNIISTSEQVSEQIRLLGESIGLTGTALTDFVEEAATGIDEFKDLGLNAEQFQDALQTGLGITQLSTAELKKHVEQLNQTKNGADNAAAGVDLISGRVGVMKREVSLATIELINLKTQQEQLSKTGQQATPIYAANAKKIAELEARIASLSDQIAKLNAAQSNTNQQISQATKRYGQLGDDIKSLNQLTQAYLPQAVKLGFQAAIVGQGLAAAGKAAESLYSALGDGDPEIKEAISNFTTMGESLGRLDFAGAAAGMGQFIGKIATMNEGVAAFSAHVAKALRWIPQFAAYATVIDQVGVTSAATTVEVADLGDALEEATAQTARANKAAQEMLAANEKESAALKDRAIALANIVKQQIEAGGVEQVFKDKVKATIDEFEKRKEVIPQALLDQANALGIVSTASEKLAEAALKAAEARAKAEEEASKRILAALKAEEEAKKKALEAAEKAYNDALAKAEEGGRSGDPEQDRIVAEAQKKVDDLKGQLDALSKVDFLSEEQRAQQDDLKDQLADANLLLEGAKRAHSGNSGAVIDEAEAVDVLNAANEFLLQSYEAAQRAHEQAINALEQEGGSVTSLADSVIELETGVRRGASALGTLEEGNFSAAESTVTFTGELEDGITTVGEFADATNKAGDEIDGAFSAAESTVGATGTAIEDVTQKSKEMATEGVAGADAFATGMNQITEKGTEAEAIVDRLIAKFTQLRTIVEGVSEGL